MNEVPLIEKVQKNDINTTIIAIKKQLKELNALLGLIDIQSDKQDLSPYVRKDEVIDEVKRFDLSPVTSNAVANSLSYSTEEKKTGGYWTDGKPIYRKCWYNLTTTPINISNLNVDNVTLLSALIKWNGGTWQTPINIGGYTVILDVRNTKDNIDINNLIYVSSVILDVTFEYTKTTD